MSGRDEIVGVYKRCESAVEKADTLYRDSVIYWKTYDTGMVGRCTYNRTFYIDFIELED